jgi:hypothetical protein
MASLLNFGGPDLLLFSVLLCVGGLFRIWMVVDCALNETPDDKIAWLLVTIFVPLGDFAYLFVRKLNRKQIAN